MQHFLLYLDKNRLRMTRMRNYQTILMDHSLVFQTAITDAEKEWNFSDQ